MLPETKTARAKNLLFLGATTLQMEVTHRHNRMDKHPKIAPEGDSGTMDSGPTWSNYEPWHNNPFYLAATY